MIIKSIQLSNFRNYEKLDISFDSETNIIYGDNAQGKTNILEAAYLSGTTKSHKGSKDKEMIRFGEDEAHIRTIVEKMTRNTGLTCICEKMVQRVWPSIKCQSKKRVSCLVF